MRPKITERAGKTSSRRSTICGRPVAIRVSFWSAEVHFELDPEKSGTSWRTPGAAATTRTLPHINFDWREVLRGRKRHGAYSSAVPPRPQRRPGPPPHEKQ